MRRWWLVLFLSSFVAAQAPQTPRQALLELLKATSPEQIDRHTPDALLAELAKLPPEMRQKQHQSMMMLSMFMAMSPNTVQTFETGPVFAVIQDPKDKSKVEVTVEHDDMNGDTDAMELGIRFTKDGQLQELPFNPRILLDMKLEKNVWKLARVGGSASIQLDDPKVAATIVKALREQAAKANAPASTSQITINGDAAVTNVQRSLRTLNKAETTYLATYPRMGYACKLSDLGGSMSGHSPDEHGAQLINPSLESGTRFGYKIEIVGCDARSYRFVAKPMDKTAGRRAFCTDESGILRSIEDAQSAECFTRGTVMR
jgi:hypothetical protein